MALRIVIVGPGRVGVALGRQLAAGGAELLGFIGRDSARAAAAVRSIAAGEVLEWSAIGRAHVVVFAVGDADLRTACETAIAASQPRACSLWVHTSGRHDLAVFAGVEGLGVRRGALHPVLPFPAGPGVVLAGAPAVLLGEPRSWRLLRRLCAMLQLEPIVASAGDRVLYHAACALAANGLTALYGKVERLLAAAGGLAPADRQRLVSALMAAALRECRDRGAEAALSGPVRRGDAATVSEHLARLRISAPEAVDSYRALMLAALDLARGALDDQTVGAVARALE